MAVVFLGNFDTPTLEVVSYKTSGLGGSGAITLLTGSSGPPGLNHLFVTSHKKG